MPSAAKPTPGKEATVESERKAMVALPSRQTAQHGEKGWSSPDLPGKRFVHATSTRGSMMPKSTAKSRFMVRQDKKFLLNAPEVSCFMAALVMVNQLRGLERAFRIGEIAKGAFIKKAFAVLAQLTKTVAATERFDILLPVTDYGEFSPFFWRWFNWWEDYFKELTPMQVTELGRLARERDSALEDCRPRDNWLNYRHTPAFIPVIT